ncbi:MAG: alpha/beta hydrolase [Saprospiraceae bacterium]|nr:alpha/beta hydrolase [Saprospiraceae bacterium]
MRLFAILLSALCSFATSAFSQSDTVILHTPTGNLHGILVVPQKIKTHASTLVIIHPGSGPTDNNGNSAMTKTNCLRMLSDSLKKAGIASLRMDKRGVAGSQAALIAEEELRFMHYVEDLKSWVNTLAQKKQFSRIYLAGHSERALVSLLPAEQNDQENGLISIAGPGQPAHTLLREQFQTQPPMIHNMINPIMDSLVAGHLVKDVNPMLYSLFRPSVQPYLISWFAHNPAEIIARIHQPTRIIQGTTDIQVNVKEASLLAEAAGNKGKKIIINEMNHVLKKIDTRDQAKQLQSYNNPELPIHPQLARSIIQFITERP